MPENVESQMFGGSVNSARCDWFRSLFRLTFFAFFLEKSKLFEKFSQMPFCYAGAHRGDRPESVSAGWNSTSIQYIVKDANVHGESNEKLWHLLVFERTCWMCLVVGEWVPKRWMDVLPVVLERKELPTSAYRKHLLYRELDTHGAVSGKFNVRFRGWGYPWQTFGSPC